MERILVPRICSTKERTKKRTKEEKAEDEGRDPERQTKPGTRSSIKRRMRSEGCGEVFNLRVGW